MLPLKLLVSTVVRITGTLKILAAFARPTVLLTKRLPLDRRDAERHLRLVIDENHRAILRRQQAVDPIGPWNGGFRAGIPSPQCCGLSGTRPTTPADSLTQAGAVCHFSQDRTARIPPPPWPSSRNCRSWATAAPSPSSKLAASS